MRTHLCAQVSLDHHTEVKLAGWIQRIRRLGALVFIDLRDISGIIQVLVESESSCAHVIEQCRSEYVIQVQGAVRKRAGAANKELSTGHLEVLATKISILSTSDALPFQLTGPIESGEDIRLQYRYLELRKSYLRDNLLFRAKLTSMMRGYLEQNHFIDIETPLLTKTTPEGARDYLVPSRIHPGSFFALPQSPQLFKQLLMVAGFDRYYQVAKCFRDEDLRADRQPEFTQFDIEMSFVTEQDVRVCIEEMMRSVFLKMKGVTLPPFPCMAYEKAMSCYGSDKPDLRIPLSLVGIDECVKKTEFKIFQEAACCSESRVVALKVPDGLSISRKKIDVYTQLMKNYGMQGLAWLKVTSLSQGRDGYQSPILKFLTDETLHHIFQKNKVSEGDILFFGAGKTKMINQALGALRQQIGKDLSLYTNEEWAFLWIIDFPLFEENDGVITALHHPFTAPQCSLDELKKAPSQVLSRAYDLVLNGFEIGGGSIRIHHDKMQEAIFDILNIDKQTQQSQFKFLLDALKYGAPPHGGIALGLDRLAMLMTKADSIKEVMAFPKTLSSTCLMTEAPSTISEQQWRELHLQKIKS